MGGDMRFLFIAVLFFVVSDSFAEEYYWKRQNSSQEFSSPSAACSDYPLPQQYSFSHIVFESESFANCWFDHTQHGKVSYQFAWRSGTTCPPDTTYNTETGECEAPEPNECEEKAGQETRFTMAGQAPDGNYGLHNGYLHRKTNHACIGSCVVQLTSSPCKTWSSGHYKCSGLAFFTGQQCGSESQVEGTASDTTPEVEKTDIPCKYETVNGVQVCTSQKTVDKQGKSCGEFNGQEVCVDKQPERDDVKIDTTVKTEPTPDGGSKTTTTNEATVTKCQGINNCKTTTTTTTKTETKDASGNTTDSKTICTGPYCGSGGDDEDGDGLGDCIGPSCAEVSSGGQGSGEGEGFGDVMGYGDALDAFMGRVKNSPLGQSVAGIAVPGGGSCSMPSRSIPIIGSVSAQGMCDLAHVLDGLRFVFLALFGFAAVRVVMSA